MESRCLPTCRRVQRECECRCPLHYRQTRVTYNDPGCACTITCATQPITLIADRWDCALLLDQGGDLWYVPAMPNNIWAGRTPQRSTAGPSSTTPA